MLHHFMTLFRANSAANPSQSVSPPRTAIQHRHLSPSPSSRRDTPPRAARKVAYDVATLHYEKGRGFRIIRSGRIPVDCVVDQEVEFDFLRLTNEIRRTFHEVESARTTEEVTGLRNDVQNRDRKIQDVENDLAREKERHHQVRQTGFEWLAAVEAKDIAVGEQSRKRQREEEIVEACEQEESRKRLRFAESMSVGADADMVEIAQAEE